MARNLKLDVILEAVDRATKPLKRITQGSKGVSRAIRASKDELRGLEAAQKDLKSFRALKRQSEQTGTALQEQQQRVAALTREIEQSTGSTKRLQQQRRGAIKQAGRLKRQYQGEQQRLQELRGTMRRVDGVTGSLSEQQRELERRMKQANARIERQQRALQGLRDADVSGRFRRMTGEVGRFARTMGLAGAITTAGIFGVANSTASLGDEVAKSADKMGMEIATLQEYRYAAERSGVSTQKFDSSIERFVKRLGEAAQGTGAAKKAYKALGLEASRLSGMKPGEAFATVADRLSEVDSQTRRVALAADFFGREGVAMVNMVKNGSAGLAQLRKDARATGYVLGDQAARRAEVFKDRLLDAELAMKGMKNTIGAQLMPAVTDLMRQFSAWVRENRARVQAFARTFGDKLKAAVPVIADMARGLAATATTIGYATSKLADLVGGFDNLGAIVGTVIAGKAIVSMVSFGGAILNAGSAMISLSSALPAVAAGVRSIGIALAANPIGAIISGIGLAAVLIYSYWEPIKAFMARLWSGVKTIVGQALEWAKTVFRWSPLGMLVRTWGAIIPWIKDLGGQIPQALMRGIRSLLGGLRETVTGVASSVVDWFTGVLGIASPSKVFSGFGGDLIQGLINGVTGMGSALKDKIVGLASRVGSWMKETVSSAIKSGREIARGLGQGIKETAGTAWKSAKGLASGTAQTVLDWLGIRSPSRVFAAIGRDTVAGLSQGLDRNAQEPARRAARIAGGMRRAAAGVAMGAGAAAMPAAANVPIDTRAPISAPAPGPQAGGGDTITINVHAAPGMDETALARRVEEILDERERQRAARRRSALHDWE